MSMFSPKLGTSVSGQKLVKPLRRQVGFPASPEYGRLRAVEAFAILGNISARWCYSLITASLSCIEDPGHNMHFVRLASRHVRRNRIPASARRSLATLPSANTPRSSPIPWFVDPSEYTSPSPQSTPKSSPSDSVPTRSSLITHPPLPADLPSTSVLAQLYHALRTSPHIEPGTLLVREPIPSAMGPPLPPAAPKGRRKRGRTYFGEGMLEGLETGGLWNWIMLAQVHL